MVLAFLKTGLISRCFDNSWGRVLDKAAVPDLLTYDQLLPAVPTGFSGNAPPGPPPGGDIPCALALP